MSLNILKNLAKSMTYSARDWAKYWPDAVLYGLIVGWDEENVYAELQQEFNWSDEFVQQLKELHQKIEKLSEEY